MRARLTIAAVLLLAGVSVAALDAALLQRLEPRDRIWLLVAYSAGPAFLGSLFILARRSTSRGAIVGLAAVLPAVFRSAFGDRTAEAAFDRLALNPFWFVLVWLPIGCALIVLLPSGDGPRGRTLPFGRRLWRFGAAITLLFVAATFTGKKGMGEESMLIVFVCFAALFVGIALLLSDVLPPRLGAAAREWSWLALAILMLIVALVAIADVHRLWSEQSSLEWMIELKRESIREINSSVKEYELERRLTDADRARVSAHLAELEQEIATYTTRMARYPAGLVPRAVLAIISLAVLVLAALLFVDEWRARRRAVPTQPAEANVPV